MWEYRHSSPNKLSGGQKQRVAIAGVVAMHPKCIVLDEPTAMLDPVGRKDVIRTVRALNMVEDVTVFIRLPESFLIQLFSFSQIKRSSVLQLQLRNPRSSSQGLHQSRNEQSL